MAEGTQVIFRKRLMDSDGNTSDTDEKFDSDDSVGDGDFVPSSSESSASQSSAVSENHENEDLKIITRGNIVSPQKNPPSRWRLLNVVCRKREKEKTRRNLGHGYKTVKGEQKPAKTIGKPCGCKNNCRVTLMGKEVEIFNSFWDLQTYDQQNNYLFGRIQAFTKNRCYPKKTKRLKSSRHTSFKYFIKTDGRDIKVCKAEFLSVHGLQNSKKRVYNICKQLSAGSSTPKADKRGRHNHQKNKLAPEIVQSVHDHIQAIPKYTSHYSRRRNPNRVYIDNDLSISSLYRDHYVPWCEEKNIAPAKEDKYRRIFCSQYNIGFKLPKSDTCETCDAYHVSLDSNKENDDVCKEIRKKLELHQRRAEAMQTNLKEETQATKNCGKKEVICFDLQQALPVPDLSVGKAFYLRKAWLYNLGIHHCNTEKGHMFTWTENIAKRGSEEIGSILLKFLNTLETSKELLFFSDNCGGQNKNWTIMSFWLQLIREKRFSAIEHRFLVSGHTHLPCDRDFSAIEKKKRYIKQVYHPDQWCDAIKDSKKCNPFSVTKVDQSDFLSFEPLLRQINKKQTTDDKTPLSFSQVRSFRFESKHPNTMFVKHFLFEDFRVVNIGKRGLKTSDFIKLENLKSKYNEPVPLNENKLQNLRQLLPFIPPKYHDFYFDLGVRPLQASSTEPVESCEPVTEHLDQEMDGLCV